jgi:PBP1b-binding outer membrane lipoprotein LpoB
MKRALLVVIAALLVAGCGSEVDPTPERKNGTPSYEFEQDDIEAAEKASDAVKEYCADAVSEAQRVGCEAHVTEDEIP